MSEFKDFICGSELNKPRMITYKNWTLKSAGEGGNRYIYIIKNGKEVAFMWVDTHFYKACFIHSVRGDMTLLPYWLTATCTTRTDYHWEYDTWEEVDKLMKRIVNFIKEAA